MTADLTPPRPLAEAFADLIQRTATDLPDDIRKALQEAYDDPKEMPQACILLQTIANNSKLARANITPICQDTGTLTFWIQAPPASNSEKIIDSIHAAVRHSTAMGVLRQNTIDTLTGLPIVDNVAPDCPVIHLETNPAYEKITAWLLMKGGGCENVSTQYSLPNSELNAGRDLDGVRACVLDAAWRAQGLGCSPGIMGVCIGGDRALGYNLAKQQLLRPLDNQSKIPQLAELERELLREVNTLGIGPMGMGGKTTLLGVKLASYSRLPASYFVTISYCCWACRRRGFVISPDGRIEEWLG